MPGESYEVKFIMTLSLNQFFNISRLIVKKIIKVLENLKKNKSSL